jgi:hypothetical protein
MFVYLLFKGRLLPLPLNIHRVLERLNIGLLYDFFIAAINSLLQ